MGKYVFRLNDHGQGPELLRQVFLERGWVEFDEEGQDDEDWNLWWRTSRFRNSDYETLRSWQQVNHYPRSTAITKKDSLARNLKRMRGVHGPSIYNFSPIAFNLPNDYTKFVAEYTRLKEKNGSKDLCWICKPADLSRGRGIFIFRDLSELQYDCNAVVQQYLTNPMLISGYKFDLRIYVMVPSFYPLNIYIYQEGLVRFGTEKFNMNALGNLYSHLTNTSINKHSPSYTADKERVGPGCKWTITQLRHYFRQSNIDDEMIWKKIINIVILTLILQANQVPKVNNCFELYGFDVILDDTLKPWLLEVNFSPALSADCQNDLMVKKPMLHDLLDFLNFEKKDQLRGHPSKHGEREKRGRGAAAGPGPGNGRLPHISGGYSKSSLMTQQRATSTLCDNDDFSDGIDSDMSGDVVPVIPGCGLPSVQQPAVQTWRSGGGNNNNNTGSSRGSSASSRKSLDMMGESHNSGTGSDGGGGHRVSSSSKLRHTTLKRVDSKGNQLSHLAAASPDAAERDHRALQYKGKRESKLSIQSDSGVSSYSGSSDNSDQNPQPEEQLPGGMAKSRRSSLAGVRRPVKPLEAEGGLTPRGGARSNQQQSASATNMALGSKSVGTMSSSTGHLMSRYALTEHVPDSLKPTQSARPPSGAATSSASRPTLPRGTRSSALRTSLHTETGKKKYGQFGYTANPLGAKSALLNRRGSLNSMFSSSKLSNNNSNYSKPWRRGHSYTNSQDTSQKIGSNSRLLKHRIGDFFLAYPFNEATRKSSAGNQDVKVVIRETQKVLKEFAATTTLQPPLFDILPLWDAFKSEGASS